MDALGSAQSMQQLLNGTTKPQKSFKEMTASEKQAFADDRQLKEVAKEFEAVLTSTILKKGLNSAMEMSGDDKDNGSKAYMELANEQIAMHVGRTGMMGISDSLYTELRMREMGVK